MGVGQVGLSGTEKKKNSVSPPPKFKKKASYSLEKGTCGNEKCDLRQLVNREKKYKRMGEVRKGKSTHLLGEDTASQAGQVLKKKSA